MLSPHPFDDPEATADLFRRPEQGMPLPLLSRNHMGHISDTPNMFNRRESPSDPGTKTNSASNRRRIAVACQRCRKRKIKCSGDPGNGMGCSNCRNAGTAPAQCTFLRVKSAEMENFLPTRGVAGGGRYSPYPTSQPVSIREPVTQFHAGHGLLNSYQLLTESCEGYGLSNGSGIPRSGHPAYAINYDEDANLSPFPKLMHPPYSSPTANASIFGPRSLNFLDSRVYHPTHPTHGDYCVPTTTATAYLGPEISLSSMNDMSTPPPYDTPLGFERHRQRSLPKPPKWYQQVKGSRAPLEPQCSTVAASAIPYRSTWLLAGNEEVPGSKSCSNHPASLSFGSSEESSSLSDPSSAVTTVESVTYPSNPRNSPATPSDAPLLPVDSLKAENLAVELQSTHTASPSGERNPITSLDYTGVYGYRGEMDPIHAKIQSASTGSYMSPGISYARARPSAFASAPDSWHKSHFVSADLSPHSAHPSPAPYLPSQDSFLSHSPCETTRRCLPSSLRRSNASTSSPEAY